MFVTCVSEFGVNDRDGATFPAYAAATATDSAATTPATASHGRRRMDVNERTTNPPFVG